MAEDQPLVPSLDVAPGNALKLRSAAAGARVQDERNGELETVLRMLMKRHLCIPENRIGRELPLNRLGLDRLDLTHLAAAFDLELGVYAPREICAEGMTLAKLTEVIVREGFQPAPVPSRVVERFSADCRMLSA
jgi:hypothetical protein